MTETIGAVLIVQDEEQDLPECLQSLWFCDEVVVVDGGSHDRTTQIAQEFSNVRLLHRPFDGFASQWGFAIDASTTDWILQIAADERVPETTSAEMVAVAKAGDVDALRFKFTFYAFGRPLRHGGYGSYSEVRFLRRITYAGMSDRMVHEHPVLHETAVVRQATGRLTHLTYATRQECVAKSERYAAGEGLELRSNLRQGTGLYLLPFSPPQVATLLRSGGKRTLRERLRPLKNQRPAHLTRVLGPAAKFLFTYLVRLGCLDGRAGLYLAYMQARYIKRKYDFALKG